MTLDTGAPAPDFTLPTDNDGSITLSDLKGKKVVVYFYPKDQTSGCTQQAIDFRDALDAFNEANTTIVGISKDSVKSHNKFKEKQELNFTLAADEETKVNQLYGVWVEKSMYGKKYMGTNRSTFLIDENGKIAQVWSKVKVKDHVQEVLKAAQSL